MVSSDFAHWGTRFRYTYYVPASGEATSLRSSDRAPKDPPIYESIRQVDFECIDACESGSHKQWLDVLSETGNTVCGRHPVGIVMAAIEHMDRGHAGDGGKPTFKFVRYERSSDCTKVGDSSVSYASAFAVM